jgi:methionyl-tRNA formyltransferase
MSDDKLIAGCGTGTVILESVQLEGKREMSGKDFMNGYHGTGRLY